MAIYLLIVPVLIEFGSGFVSFSSYFAFSRVDFGLLVIRFDNNKLRMA